MLDSYHRDAVVEGDGDRAVLVRSQDRRASRRDRVQLHAAAVLTDSGGVQREAAWLGTPCLVLRSTTEWTEAVNESQGRMVVVGLDRAAVANELARVAPAARSSAAARMRARSLSLRPAGAARRIVDALDTGPR